MCRPYGVKMIPPIRRGRTFSRPAGGTAIPEPTLIRPLRGHLPPGRGKAFGRPHGAAFTKGFEPCPLIRHGFAVPPSPQGEGFQATARVAPTAGTGPATLVRSRQARRWNRTYPNFCKPRAQWPGRKRSSPLHFCAPEMAYYLPVGRPP